MLPKSAGTLPVVYFFYYDATSSWLGGCLGWSCDRTIGARNYGAAAALSLWPGVTAAREPSWRGSL